MNALGCENRRLDLSAIDIDAAMLRQCAHFNTHMLGDILVCTIDLDLAQGHCCCRKRCVIDVKTVVIVDSNGT